MTLPTSVAIIGLGLMGGSLARELAARKVTVFAHDADDDTLGTARRSGTIRDTLGPELNRVARCEIVILATPVDVALDTLTRIAPHLAPDTLVADVGSTKRRIVEHAEALGLGERFVGSHPLAGDHRSGWDASRIGLYRGTHVFVCPAPSTRAGAIDRVRNFWSELGATTEVMDPDEHDRRLAWVSHLPQVASSAVAAALSLSEFGPDALGPGGRDVTRLAASSPSMWSAICLANADHLARATDALQDRLEQFRSALGADDQRALENFFRAGRNWVDRSVPP